MGFTAAQFAAFERAQRSDENVPIYFSIGIGSLMIIFIIRYWLSFLLPDSRSTSGRASWATSRVFRSVLLRRLPIFGSIGCFLLFACYHVINAFVVMWDLDHSQLTFLAGRMGWVVSVNLALVVILALKNTPLAILTPYSYERLNIFHQMAGYTTIVFLCVHVIGFVHSWIGTERSFMLTEKSQINGMVAGGCMVMTLFVAVVLRRFSYEIFYVAHVAFFIIIIITVGLHQPDIGQGILKITIFTAAIWFIDRVLRFLRVSYHAFGCSVSITALPLNSVRLRFSARNSLWRAEPGSHVYLWIPGVRSFEMHPFTLVNTNPPELVIAGRDGFTHDLRQKAIKYPNRSLRASLDGPYGSLPSWGMFDRVMLVAGGSGASFCIGVALGLARRAATMGEKAQKIFLIWVIRDHECLTWFANELDELLASPHVTIRIYITRKSSSQATPSMIANRVLSAATPFVADEAPDSTTREKSTPESQPVYNSALPISGPPTAALDHDAITPVTPTSTQSDPGFDTSSAPPDNFLTVFPSPPSHPFFSRSAPSSPQIQPPPSDRTSSTPDLEKSLAVATSTAVADASLMPEGDVPDIRTGRRPNVGSLVKEFVVRGGVGSGVGKQATREGMNAAVDGADADQEGKKRLIVVACGPGSMMDAVREAVVEVLKLGQDVEMYLERFGW